jgi:hypothetical protein
MVKIFAKLQENKQAFPAQKAKACEAFLPHRLFVC